MINAEAIENWVSCDGSGKRFVSGRQPYSAETPEGITVIIAKGNICDVTVDGIANSISGDFELSRGVISASILSRAGPGIQAELNGLRPPGGGRVQAGDVFVTGGHNASAQYVFHGVLRKWSNGDEQCLRKFIKNVLTQASRRGLGSVAFPAVGTGKLGYPADVVAKCFFDKIGSFSFKQRSTCSVREVQIVVYDKDLATFATFNERLSEIVGSSASPVSLQPERGLRRSIGDKVDDKDAPVADQDTPTRSVKDIAKVFESNVSLSPQDSSPASPTSYMGFPRSWGPEDKYDPYRMVELNVSDIEYDTVRQNVLATAGGSVQNIVKIQRIENHREYRKFCLLGKEMVKVNDLSVPNERRLWHGTARDSLGNIAAGGMNRGYCGKNATAYGDGVYYATDFSYSAKPTYSPPDVVTGHKYVFQCRVLTGHYVRGTTGLKEPPTRAGHIRYDSVVDNTDKPTMFVVFKDGQAYPEYLVTFN